MKSVVSVIFYFASVLISGCSTLSHTILNKSVIENDLDGPGTSTLAMGAERRLAISKPIYNDLGKLIDVKVCAEAQPDVAKATELKSEGDAALEVLAKGKLDVSSTEELKEILSIVYQRTERSDLVRQLGWQICQGYMNEALEQDQYYELLQMLIVASIVDNPGDLANAFSTLN